MFDKLAGISKTKSLNTKKLFSASQAITLPKTMES